MGRVDLSPGPATMEPPSPAYRPLALAYLALADDPDPALAERSPPRTLIALVAAIVLAFAAPIAWVSATHGQSRDAQATVVAKAGVQEDDGDDADGS